MRLIFIFIFFVSNVLAQDKIRPLKPFVELGTYIHSGFEKSIIPTINGGIEYRLMNHIRPEIGLGIMVSSTEDRFNYGSDGILIDASQQSVLALNLTFIPKIVIGNENDGDVLFYILPIFARSTIEAREYYLKYDPSKELSEERFTSKKTQLSFGIGLGFVAKFSEDSKDSFNLNLYLNGVDLGKTINKLPHNSEIFDTKYTLGIGLKYYFGIKNKS